MIKVIKQLITFVSIAFSLQASAQSSDSIATAQKISGKWHLELVVQNGKTSAPPKDTYISFLPDGNFTSNSDPEKGKWHLKVAKKMLILLSEEDEMELNYIIKEMNTLELSAPAPADVHMYFRKDAN